MRCIFIILPRHIEVNLSGVTQQTGEGARLVVCVKRLQRDTQRLFCSHRQEV